MKCRRLLPFIFFALTPFLLAHSNPAVFAPAVSYDSGKVAAVAVAVGDVNGDGKPDLLVVNECQDISCVDASGSVGVLLGNGDGSFQTAVNYGSGGFLAYSVAVADVNGDGKLDLVVANECSESTCANKSSVGVLLGNGDGTFQPAVTFSSGGYANALISVAVGDVNGDGQPDLVVANECSDSNCGVNNGTVGVLLGNGDGTFRQVVPYDSGGWETLSVAVADVNGDGKPDLLVASPCVTASDCSHGSAGVLLGNGDGTFQQAVSYSSGGWDTLSMTVWDVNGDGKPDLVVASECSSSATCQNGGLVGALLGNGDGTFQPVVLYGSGGWRPFSVAVADVNLDGKPDLVVQNECSDSNCMNNSGSVGVLPGNGDGTFQQVTTYGSGGYASLSVAVGDVNGDGKPDVLTANVCVSASSCANGVVGVLINMTPSPYKAYVRPPIRADGDSIFSADRGVLPVKFILTKNNTRTCYLPPATISVARTAGGVLGPVSSGSNLGIDSDDCQYIYQLAASALGVGKYRVDISINGIVVGHAVFALKERDRDHHERND